jgi:hypothetical protein
MTTTVGNYEDVTLDVAPHDGTTVVTLTTYSPHGVVVAPVNPVTTATVGAVLRASATVGYDEPGVWVQVWTVTGTGAGVTHRSVYAEAIDIPPTQVWPPTLAQLKSDLKIAPDDTEQDIELARQLDAAIVFVEDRRAESFNFHDESLVELPDPTVMLALGTIRLAGRWNARKRSQDGLVLMGPDLGTSRVPSFDPDIDRMLGIGRFSGPEFA